MKTILTAALLSATVTGAAWAEPVAWELDPSHSQIVFTYNHLGYSTGTGMFSGFEGDIMFDQENPENSSVEVSFPVRSMLTGWEARFEHFMSDDFFGAGDESDEMVTFASTSIAQTGEDTAEITGDLTLNGVTKEVVLDATLNQVSEHPMEGEPWAGFDATTTLLRSDYNVGMFAPYVSDEVEVRISIEAMQADGQDS
ncbi:Polyisoprenoid-binding protein YceI [Tranquillimonas rosea]|uniref:Polyisoprenoid-binding protein YceI n=1 Tax=Tranquillimonas rosea TaxID=641238 RepID=A0A1H9PUG3_9RHOB|nr:YceI family protein [Tranquillimonas rosea]SER51867.1 Polyisoprenoid-binding protein YceI [Tranquillimonas rosea]